MKKKSILTKNLKLWKWLDISVYFVIFFIKLIHSLYNSGATQLIIDYLIHGELFVKIVLIVILLFMVLINSLPLMLIYFGISRAIKKQIKNNITFDVTTDLDYYRDKLSNLSPLEISLLIDLKVEYQKDIKAMVLYYEINDFIEINNNKIEVKNWDDPKLKESDKKILRYLTYNNWGNEMLTLEKDVCNEAVRAGLIKHKGINEQKSGCGIFTVIYALLWIVLLLSGTYIFNHIFDIEATLINAPVEADIVTQVEFILKDPLLFKLICAALLFSFALVGHFWIFISGIINKIMSNNANIRYPYKRTAYGNELTEKIYGLKNFIRDFSNLSEASKEQIVLWEEFLIYAVVLGENQVVLKEIGELMHKDLNKYNSYN